MIRKAYALICLPIGFLVGCGGSSSSNSGSTPAQPQVVAITATGGSAQTSASGKPFKSAFTAVVTSDGVRTGGEKVTFTAPASGASGTFANGTATEDDITDDTGVATSSPFTANSVGGTYTVTATVKNAPDPVSFSLTNIVVNSYAFYMSGQEANGSFYVLAGAVDIDPSGNVIGGEQDFNDGSIFSPEPKGDKILSGTLTSVGPAGQRTLTVKTDNTSLGLAGDGTETFGLQFVNGSHALISQFDGFATSSGSLDAQTLPSTLNGPFAFALSGVDASFTPLAFGGVFSLNGTSITNGKIDVNDSFSLGVFLGKPFSGTLSTQDSYGRGSIKGIRVAGATLSLVYYVVGPEAIRIVDVGPAGAALPSGASVGSAFGQGAGTFSNASLGQSVLAFNGNQLSQFAGVAQLITSNTSSTPANFTGVGDESEPLNGLFTSPASPIAGTYSIAANGYGNLAFSNTTGNYPGLGNTTALGIYMTDPALNVNDPNNSTGGGGALVVGLDGGHLTGIPLPGAAGVLVPQTDAATATTDFAGNYAAGWQNFNSNSCGCEFDMLAQGTMVANGALSLTGLVSDPLSALQTPDTTSKGNTFTGTPVPDTQNPGRYSMLGAGALTSVVDGAAGPNFEMVIYQASGAQLFWFDYDATNLTTVALGPLEQQGTLTGVPAVGKRAAIAHKKR